jgi:hypothetical protein
MFAKAYMGRKWILPMLSLYLQGLLILAAFSVPTYQKRWEGCAHLFRPMYAVANMGHPFAFFRLCL